MRASRNRPGAASRRLSSLADKSVWGFSAWRGQVSRPREGTRDDATRSREIRPGLAPSADGPPIADSIASNSSVVAVAMKQFALAGLAENERTEVARLLGRAGTTLDEPWTLHEGEGRADLGRHRSRAVRRSRRARARAERADQFRRDHRCGSRDSGSVARAAPSAVDAGAGRDAEPRGLLRYRRRCPGAATTAANAPESADADEAETAERARLLPDTARAARVHRFRFARAARCADHRASGPAAGW